MPPRAPVENLRDGLACHTEPRANGSQCRCAAQQTNGLYISGGEFCLSTRFTATGRVGRQADGDGVLDVLCLRDPFQIAAHIVQAIAINVIRVRLSLLHRIERKEYEPVYAPMPLDAVLRQKDLKISSVGQTWGEYESLTGTCSPSNVSYATKIANLVHALVMNNRMPFFNGISRLLAQRGVPFSGDMRAGVHSAAPFYRTVGGA